MLRWLLAGVLVAAWVYGKFRPPAGSAPPCSGGARHGASRIQPCEGCAIPTEVDPFSDRHLCDQCDGQYVTDDASIFDDPLDATRPYESLFHDARGHFPSLPSHDRFDGDSFP